MASSLCFSPVCSFNSTNKPGIVTGNSAAGNILRVNQVFQKSNKTAKFQSFEVKATSSDSTPPPATPPVVKRNSILCEDCEGNGAKVCTQCKGDGVNSVDHFNGQFKAGGLCWLCRGKREILCGNCNGAGFVGGFMSTMDS